MCIYSHQSLYTLSRNTCVCWTNVPYAQLTCQYVHVISSHSCTCWTFICTPTTSTTLVPQRATISPLYPRPREYPRGEVYQSPSYCTPPPPSQPPGLKSLGRQYSPSAFPSLCSTLSYEPLYDTFNKAVSAASIYYTIRVSGEWSIVKSYKSSRRRAFWFLCHRHNCYLWMEWYFTDWYLKNIIVVFIELHPFCSLALSFLLLLLFLPPLLPSTSSIIPICTTPHPFRATCDAFTIGCIFLRRW